LHDSFANRSLCCDRNRLLPFAPDNRPNDPEHNQGDRSVNDLLFTPGATLFHRQRRGSGCAYALVHRRGGSRGKGVRISRLFDSCKRNPVHNNSTTGRGTTMDSINGSLPGWGRSCSPMRYTDSVSRPNPVNRPFRVLCD
jgi:hypothetical protein